MFFELNGRYLVWASNFNSNLMSRITPSVVKNDLRAYYFLTLRNFFPVVNLGSRPVMEVHTLLEEHLCLFACENEFNKSLNPPDYYFVVFSHITW